MTPAEHIDAAEHALAIGMDAMDTGAPEEAKLDLLTAIAHALIALAVESGVPHATGAPPEAVNG